MSIAAIVAGVFGVLMLLAAYQWYPIDQVKFDGSTDREAVSRHVLSRSIGWWSIGVAMGLLT